MSSTEERVRELRARGKDLVFGRLPNPDLWAVGYENGYAVDVRAKDAYMPRREPSYVLGFVSGRRQKAIDIAVQLQDPFSDESRLRAAEARYGGSDIRRRLVERNMSPEADWHLMLRYVAPMRTSATQTPIYEAVRNHLSGWWTPYLRRWRLGSIDGPEILPVDAPSWPIYRAAVGAPWLP